VHKSLRSYSRNFTQLAYSVSRKGGKRVLLLKKNLWKNFVNLVKDMPIIHVYFIEIIMTLSLPPPKKIGGRNFVPPFLDHVPGAKAV